MRGHALRAPSRVLVPVWQERPGGYPERGIIVSDLFKSLYSPCALTVLKREELEKCGFIFGRQAPK